MKNKASLVLMEQLVMVLVFALAAVVCLGIFFRAEELSETSRRREEGAYLAQNGAELLKSGGSLEEMSLPEGYYVTFVPEDSETEGLAVGTVEVWHEGEKELVFSLKVGWQEDLP